RALFRAALAADTPVGDDDLAAVPLPDRADGALGGADRIQARPAGRRNEEAGESRAVEVEPAPAVCVGLDAGLDTLIAAGAAIQIDEHQGPSLDQSESFRVGRLERRERDPRRVWRGAAQGPGPPTALLRRLLQVEAETGRTLGLQELPDEV